MPAVSAGLLLYRRVPDPETGARRVEVLLVHPGGPYWARKDAGAWSIPKGMAEPDELGPEPATATAAKARNRAAGADLLAVARRETREETGVNVEGPVIPLGTIRYQKSGKVIHAFAAPAPPDANPRCASWEVDRAEFVPLDQARRLLHPDQAPFLDRLARSVAA